MPTHGRRVFLALAAASSCGAAVSSAQQQSAESPAPAPPAADATAEVRTRAREAEMRNRVAYGKALVERFGPEVLAVIEATTVREARTALERTTLERRGLPEVKTLLWNHLGAPFEWRLVSESAAHLEFRVTSCPYATRMRELGAADLGFAYYCAYDVGFCQGLDPTIRFTRTRTLMKGDDCCDHRYER